MVQIDVNFEIPKTVIKKLNIVFNLDTITTDEYELVVLADVSGLIKDNLNKFDSTLTSKESTNYSRPSVQMTISESVTGYNIGYTSINVAVAGGVCKVGGFLIIKKSSKDILAACLTLNSVNLNETFNIFPETSLYVFGEKVCTA